MQRKPLGDGHSLPTVTRPRHLKRQACLNGLLLQPLEVVLSPGLLQLAPVGPGLAQLALENSGDIIASARGFELDALTRLRPKCLGHQDMKMGRQLQATPKPLGEADACPLRKPSPVPGSLGLLTLPAPDGFEEPPLEALEQSWLLHDCQPYTEGQTERPLPMGDARQDGRQVEPGLRGAAGGA